MKVIRSLVLVLFLALLVLFCVSCKTKTSQTEYYTMTAVVVEVNRDEDSITFESDDGNLWGWYECGTLNLGDKCIITMSDNATPDTLEDDRMIDVSILYRTRA